MTAARMVLLFTEGFALELKYQTYSYVVLFSYLSYLVRGTSDCHLNVYRGL